MDENWNALSTCAFATKDALAMRVTGDVIIKVHVI
jgi:hypothetical protein